MTQNNMLRATKLLCYAILTIFTSQCFSGCTKNTSGKPVSVYATIAANPNYSILAAAVNKVGLKDALNDAAEGGITLFAPDNKAFDALGITSAGGLSAIPDSTLKAILLYHVLPIAVKASQIPEAANTPTTTLNGQPVYVTRTASNQVFVDGVTVTKADILCTNGVIHEIGQVLMPAIGTIVQTAEANSNLSLLVAAVLRASQGSTNVAAVLSGTGPFTVFAPTNQAFANAGFPDVASINAADPNTLTSILTYHVVAGRIFSSDLVNGSMPATVNGETVKIIVGATAQVKGNGNAQPSNIVAANIVTTNGVVHVIDQVLLP
jgi:uncharacterized surface protein with fasciclin (FAS1) repeats